MSGLSAQYIIDLLDEYLESEFTFIRTDELAAKLISLEAHHQTFILGWVKSLASTQVELAHKFIVNVVRVLDVMDRQTIEEWAGYTLDTYDRSGLYAAMEVIRNVEQYVDLSRERQVGSVYSEVCGVLAVFVRGLSGRELRLKHGEHCYTDSETLYLVNVVSLLDTKQDNFSLYKAMVAMQWAQTRFGTFRCRPLQKLGQYENPRHATALFHRLETIRLEACIERELPGLYRRMLELKQRLRQVDYAGAWQSSVRVLRNRGATAADALGLVAKHYAGALPPAVCYQGELRLHEVEKVMQARMGREKVLLRVRLSEMLDEVTPEGSGGNKESRRFALRNKASESTEAGRGENDIPEPGARELTLDGLPVVPPAAVSSLLTSIQLDLGRLPDEYLTPAGAGEYDPNLLKDAGPGEAWQGAYHEDGAELYDEWDAKRDHYRKHWCVLREQEVKIGDADFARRTLRKYHGLIERLRKNFEAMRDEDSLLKRQANGDDVDIDALVEALADAADGREMTDRLFTRTHRRERNIAAAFMVDMSGSTRGWINDAERESLVLLCEALELLGDRYAIYGFSGNTRKRCYLYHIKSFDEGYTSEVKGRIANIKPQEYTRMGVAIRHLAKILRKQEAKTRMLITLADGKPDDIDHYRGEYGIEDTRKALIEAKYAGIHPFCITIDERGQDYLPYMYGAVNYTVVDDVAKLPARVSDIYRKLTT